MKHLPIVIILNVIFAGCCKDEEESYAECGEPVSYQGYDYQTVLIGDQCWFAENLRNEDYQNGDAIPSNLGDSDWDSTTSGAMAVYGEGEIPCQDESLLDGDECDETWSLNEYGRLYNWYTVADARGLCPIGWHVPTDLEWTVMTNHLGGEDVAGDHMKTDYGWYVGGNGTNSSGFSGLPGGYRDNEGFSFAGITTSWWSSSQTVGSEGSSNNDAFTRFLVFGEENVGRGGDSWNLGYSVRCIKDAE